MHFCIWCDQILKSSYRWLDCRIITVSIIEGDSLRATEKHVTLHALVSHVQIRHRRWRTTADQRTQLSHRETTNIYPIAFLSHFHNHRIVTADVEVPVVLVDTPAGCAHSAEESLLDAELRTKRTPRLEVLEEAVVVATDEREGRSSCCRGCWFWNFKNISGARTPKLGVKSYYLANFFPENYMKTKEIRPMVRSGADAGFPQMAPHNQVGASCIMYVNHK